MYFDEVLFTESHQIASSMVGLYSIRSRANDKRANDSPNHSSLSWKVITILGVGFRPLVGQDLTFLYFLILLKCEIPKMLQIYFQRLDLSKAAVSSLKNSLIRVMVDIYCLSELSFAFKVNPNASAVERYSEYSSKIDQPDNFSYSCL